MSLPTFSSISGMHVCVGETGPFCNTRDAAKLRDENAKLREALDGLWTAATDFRRVPTHAPFGRTLEEKREVALRVLLET